MSQPEIRTMLETIGRKWARLTFRRSTEEYPTQVAGCWTTGALATKKVKCSGCQRTLKDGDVIDLEVNVEESEFAPGKPGCHTKKAWHVACMGVPTPNDEVRDSIPAGHVLMTDGRTITSSHDDNGRA